MIDKEALKEFLAYWASVIGMVGVAVWFGHTLSVQQNRIAILETIVSTRGAVPISVEADRRLVVMEERQVSFARRLDTLNERVTRLENPPPKERK